MDNGPDKNISYFNDINPKDINSKIKNGAGFLVSNFATIIFLSAAAIIIATTWLNIEITNIVTVWFATDAALTMVLFCVTQLATQDKGKKNGKCDPEYLIARDKYLAVREKVIKLGAPHIDEFVTESIASSLKRHIIAILYKHCKGLKYDEWYDFFRTMDKKQLQAYCKYVKRKPERDLEHYPLKRSQIPALLAILKLKPIKLTPEMMILEESETWRNDGIAPSPNQILRRKSKFTLAQSVLVALFGASLSYKLFANPSLEAFMYAGVQLFLLCWRAFQGYSTGFLSYSVSGVAYHTSQRQKCEEYLAWLERKKTEQEPQGDVVPENIEIVLSK